MASRKIGMYLFLVALVGIAALPASAQSFRVQCPDTTITHPKMIHDNNSEPNYTGPTVLSAPSASTYQAPLSNVNGAIKCQQISGGDGYATMADGTQTFMFSFGPLSGLGDISNGLPGTEFPNVFNTIYSGAFHPGDPDTTVGGPAFAGSFTYNGAVGLAYDFYPDANGAPLPGVIDGHVDPRQIMDVGVMNGNIPAPLMAFDEDDEFFLTLSNVGMIMRPDLFEQHTVHFHGYPNASSVYDGVPDASVAINIGGSFTYYYLAPDAGTYFWHCHITPPEHLQMGMVGQLYVRPRQNRVPAGTSLVASLLTQQNDLRTACRRPGDGGPTNATNATFAPDILCSNPMPANAGILAPNTTATAAAAGVLYAYNDGDGISAYEVEYPLQIHGFDPNFHFVGMTFNPEAFAQMKDKYFLLNGRSYPDTVTPGPLEAESADGAKHFSQPMPAIITVKAGQRALLRIADLDVSEYQTLASLGIPMHVVGYNAKLLRDQAGNNMDYYANSITLGGGESLDAILDTCLVRAAGGTCTTTVPVGTYYLYTPNLDHLSNDAENFGGLMTEVHVN